MYEQIVYTSEMEPSAVLLDGHSLIAEDSYSCGVELAGHQFGICPVIMISEDGEHSEPRPQASEGPGAAGNVTGRMRDVVSGQCNEIGLEQVGHADGFRDLSFTQKLAVVDIRKLDYSK